MSIRDFCVPLAVLTSVVTPVHVCAQSADDNVTVSVGLRTFINRIDGVGFGDLGIPGLRPLAVTVSSGAEVSFLPSISVRKGPLVLSASFQPETRYTIKPPETGAEAHPKRREWDVGIGYSLLPNMVVSLGWKDIDVRTSLGGGNSGPALPLSQKYSGPFFGLATSASIGGNWSLYGTIAYGRPRLEIGGEKSGSSTDYVSTEFGLTYSLREIGAAFKNASMVVGYRSQTTRSKNVPYSYVNIDPSRGAVGFANNSQSYRTSIDGLTLGVAFVF